MNEIDTIGNVNPIINRELKNNNEDKKIDYNINLSHETEPEKLLGEFVITENSKMSELDEKTKAVVSETTELLSKRIQASDDFDLTDVKSENKEVLKTMMSKIDNYVTKIKVFESRIEMKMVSGSTKFKVIVNKEKAIGDNDNVAFFSVKECKLLFDKSIINKSVKPGNFKTVIRSYSISPDDIIPIMSTTQKILEENDKMTVSRERIVLQKCRELNIPGTPNTHLITSYVGKGDIVKQRIIQTFYPGGNLKEALEKDPDEGGLNFDEKKVVAVELCRTLHFFHKAGMSHNDYKLANIMLDEKKKPILIDFGSTTISGIDQHLTCDPKCFPPEMVNRSEMDEMIKFEREIKDFKDKIKELKKQIHEPEIVNDSNNDNIKITEEINKLEDAIFYDEYRISNANELYRDELFYSLKPQNWIPQKNDDFNLGMVLSDMFYRELKPFENVPEDEIPADLKKIKIVISGLTENDPSKRISPLDALEILIKVPA